MIDVLFVLPDDNGIETAYGKVFKFSCREDDSVGVLFDAIRERLGVIEVRLSLEVTQDDMVALAAINPHDPATVGSRVTSGTRIIVGYRKEQ